MKGSGSVATMGGRRREGYTPVLGALHGLPARDTLPVLFLFLFVCEAPRSRSCAARLTYLHTVQSRMGVKNFPC